MKSNTAYNHFTRLRSRLDSIYSAALIYCPTHRDLLEQITAQVWSDEGLKRCPAWVRSNLSERNSMHFDKIQRERVVWLFPVDGKSVSWDLLTDDQRKDYCKADVSGVHYWLRDTTPCVGTIANPGNYQTGETISRTFVITDKKW